MESNVFEALKTFEFDFEQCKKDSFENCFGSLSGKLNFMYGLKGENHPSYHWHKNEATKEYYDNKSKSVKESWMDDFERRKQHSEKMKERWTTGKITSDIVRKNGQHGLSGKDIHNTLEIEYKGVVYYGWSELLKKTKVSKHLYKKYYLNGIDPELRIGCDGPIRKSL